MGDSEMVLSWISLGVGIFLFLWAFVQVGALRSFLLIVALITVVIGLFLFRKSKDLNFLPDL